LYIASHSRPLFSVFISSTKTLTSVCYISAFADAAIDPIDFPTAPAYAIPKVNKQTAWPTDWLTDQTKTNEQSVCLLRASYIRKLAKYK